MLHCSGVGFILRSFSYIVDSSYSMVTISKSIDTMNLTAFFGKYLASSVGITKVAKRNKTVTKLKEFPGGVGGRL